MIFDIAKKEFHHNLLTFRFLFGGLICLLVIPLAAWVGSRDYKTRLATYDGKVNEAENQIEQVHIYSRLFIRVERPPSPLSIFNQGYDVRMGTQTTIGYGTPPSSLTGGNRGNEYLVEFQGLDITTVVRVILSLLALLLTFDAISGEREAGTLRLLLANRVARWQIILGKYLGALITLAVPLVAALILVALVVLSVAHIYFTASLWIATFTLAASYLLYASIMLLLGFAISVLVRSSAVSLILTLTTWFLLIFVTPNMGSMVVKYLGPKLPDRREYSMRASLLWRELNQQLRKLRPPELGKVSAISPPPNLIGGDHPGGVHFGTPKYYDLLANYNRQVIPMQILYGERASDMWDEYRRQFDRISEIENIIDSVSPAHLLTVVAESLTYTSLADHDRFIRACRSYRVIWLRWLEEKNAFGSWRWFTDDYLGQPSWITLLFGLDPNSTTDAEVQQLVKQMTPFQFQRLNELIEQMRNDPKRRLDLTDMPRFLYKFPSLLETVVRAIVPFMLLIFWNIVAFIISFVSFLRYDPR